jgi:hypothetical protein
LPKPLIGFRLGSGMTMRMFCSAAGVDQPDKARAFLNSFTLNLNKMLFPSVETSARGLYPTDKQKIPTPDVGKILQ